MVTERSPTMPLRTLFYSLVIGGLAWAAFAQLTESWTDAPQVPSRVGVKVPESQAATSTVESVDLGPTIGSGWRSSQPLQADRGDSVEAWHQAAQYTAMWRPGNLEDLIGGGLVDPDPENRIDAIFRAYELDRDVAKLFLQEVIISETNGLVYEAAVDVLQDIAGESAVALVTTALGDPDVAYRAQAVEEFSRVGQPAIHLLGQVLLGDPEPELRLMTVQRLSEIAGLAAMSLLEGATQDSDPIVSRAARDALAALARDAESTDAWADDLISTAYLDAENDPEGLFIEFKKDSGPRERVEGIRRLYSFDGEDSIHILKTVLERDEELAVREEALITLELIGGDAAAAAIEVALGDGSPEMRHRAIETLWMTESAHSLPLMGQVLYSDPDPAVRLNALRMLATDPNPAARALIEVAQSDPDDGVSNLAVSLSGQ